MAHSMGTLKRRLNTVLLDARRTRTFWHQLVADAFPVVNEVVNTVIQAKYASLSSISYSFDTSALLPFTDTSTTLHTGTQP